MIFNVMHQRKKIREIKKPSPVTYLLENETGIKPQIKCTLVLYSQRFLAVNDPSSV